MRIFKKPSIFATSAFASCAVSFCVNAEDVDEPKKMRSLEEVVVTAQRREQALGDVPASIVAMNQESLDTKGVKDVTDLSRITPGVNLSPSWGGSTIISVRGVSSRTGAATTGIYIDDTPIQTRQIGVGATATNAYPMIYDLERVEVLRGPQGTLFGSGSQGGTIRFITRKPSTYEYSGSAKTEISFTEGADPSYEYGAAFGGPIIEDKVGFRTSVMYRDQGGWIDRVPYGAASESPEKNSNGSESLAVKTALTFNVTGNFQVTPSVFYQKIDLEDTSQYWRELSDPSSEKYVTGNALAEPMEDRLGLYSLDMEYDAGDVTIVSNSSFLDRNQKVYSDYSIYLGEIFGAPFGSLLPTDARSMSEAANIQEAFTQEIRVQSNPSGSPLTWVAGVFYQDSKQEADQNIWAMPDSETVTLNLLGVPISTSNNSLFWALETSQDIQKAIFAQFDYEYSSNLNFTLGGRYAQSEVKGSNFQAGPLGNVPLVKTTYKENTFNPKVGVQYYPNDSVMVYVTAAKGFRPGGSNTPLPATLSAICSADLAALGSEGLPDGYKSDEVWSYETGLKGTVGDSVSFETSAYLIDWDNIQNLATLGCGWNFISNLGSAQIKGFDTSMTIRATDNLRFEAALAYTDARFSEDVFIGNTTFVEKGDKLNTPPWSLAFSADYEFIVGQYSTGYLHMDYQFQSSYQVSPNVTAFSFDMLNPERKANKKLSARVGVRTDEFDVSLFVNNLTNSHDVLGSVRNTQTSPFVRDSGSIPRTVGLSVNYTFN